VAIYDEDANRGRAFAERFGVTTFHETVDHILARDDIDAVIICSPTNVHADLAIAAACAGSPPSWRTLGP
jgi:predicted dehydrogenase